ncbi:hypothetical protein psal_cds_148 [Pandoravirus salinus]|uniref:Uncharacterized protein n=1 Tax=Pandoravirus salinus TaxID=1349410 RepID=S4VW16_9VIRU|nr:hypothetical protein psal_cds_148 [Pandoravirus salinus]AGO83616.1 hypothetical protein psal_cds_148 [Pandoravirus salinus]
MSLAPTLPASPGCIERLTLEHPDLAYVFGPEAARDPAAQAFRALLGVTGAGADCDQIMAALRARQGQIEQGAANIARSTGGGMGSLLRQQQRDDALMAASALGASLTGLPVGPLAVNDAIDDLAQQACASGWGNATRDQVNLVYDRAEARGIPGAADMTLAQVCAALAAAEAQDAAEDAEAAAEAVASATVPYGTGAAAPSPYAPVPYGRQAAAPAPWYGPYGVTQPPPPGAWPPTTAPAPSPVATEIAAANAAQSQARAYDDLARQLERQSEVTAAQAAQVAAQAAEARTLSRVQRNIATATAANQQQFGAVPPLYGSTRRPGGW